MTLHSCVSLCNPTTTPATDHATAWRKPSQPSILVRLFYPTCYVHGTDQTKVLRVNGRYARRISLRIGGHYSDHPCTRRQHTELGPMHLRACTVSRSNPVFIRAIASLNCMGIMPITPSSICFCHDIAIASGPYPDVLDLRYLSNASRSLAISYFQDLTGTSHHVSPLTPSFSATRTFQDTKLLDPRNSTT